MSCLQVRLCYFQQILISVLMVCVYKQDPRNSRVSIMFCAKVSRCKRLFTHFVGALHVTFNQYLDEAVVTLQQDWITR